MSGPDEAAFNGLSEEEAARRLAADGPNALVRQKRRSLTRILIDVMREPMLLLLAGGGLVYFLLGDVHEALILLVFACVSITITVAQEARTERAIEALRDLTSPRARVIRDGRQRRIAGRDLVRGDLVLMAEGERVPADGILLENDGLSLDESILTGESVPVGKGIAVGPHPSDMARPGGEGLPFVYSGTLVVRGAGLFEVRATGARTEIGRIGQDLSRIEAESPRLQKETRRLVGWMALLGGAASLLCVLLYGLFRGSWLDAVLAGIALGMSMLPEEFPVVLTVFMAMGAMRMSRARVLSRQASAIEELGSATVLCTDKTGTLTENRMRIAELRLADGRACATAGPDRMLEADFAMLGELGVLASAVRPTDPMEQAFHDLSEDASRARSEDGWALRHHYRLDPGLLAMSHVWARDGADHLVAAKGAPEAIADLCGLDDAARLGLRAQVDAMARAGLRVLGVAEARWPENTALPDTHRSFDFAFRGLVGLADPIRASVPDAVRQCRAAGIRVVMITGDYPQTAQAIARQAGIEAASVLTGDALASLDDATLVDAVQATSVFARIMPEQKLRLVTALKAAGERVAMTGDGVNDAPALKAAHIGIAMGGRGTDVAREASALVLLDDDFESITRAIRLGRRIYDNLRKAMGFIVAVHIPIAGLALLPLVSGMPLLLGPIHIAFLEMIIDPVCSLAFEAETEEGDLMKRPPRPPATPMVSRGLLGWAALQGVAAMLLVIGVTLYLWSVNTPLEVLRSTAFGALVLSTFVLILINRRFSPSLGAAVLRPNLALGVVALAVVSVLSATQALPVVGRLFGFAPTPLPLLGMVVILVVGLFIGLEALKPVWRRQMRA
ncbi:MAG: cation-translocating P-type ATPase [Chakrabartia godavariana]